MVGGAGRVGVLRKIPVGLRLSLISCEVSWANIVALGSLILLACWL